MSNLPTLKHYSNRISTLIRTQSDPAEGTVEQSVMRLKTLFGMPGGGNAEQQKQLHESKYGMGDRR